MKVVGMNRESPQWDLFNAIEADNFLRWRMQVQILTEAEASPYNPFDLTIPNDIAEPQPGLFGKVSPDIGIHIAMIAIERSNFYHHRYNINTPVAHSARALEMESRKWLP